VAVVFLLTAAAVVVVLFLHLHNKTARGSFLFKGSSNLTVAQRTELKGQQQQFLADPALHAAAVNIARNSGTSPGFLGDEPADKAEFSTLAASAEWDETGEQLIFTLAGTDDSDKPRMSALLDALYARNKSLNDEAGHLHAAYAEAVRAADDARSRLEDLDRRIRHDAELANSADTLKGDAAKIKASLEGLVRDRDAAEATVRALEAEIKPLEPAVSVTEAPTTAPTTRSSDSVQAAPAVAVNPDDDEQVKQLAAEQEQMKASLKAAKDARDAQASQAATLLDAAQKQFDAQIQAARNAVGGGGAMAEFLATLKGQEDIIHHLNDELIQEQKDERQLLDNLKEDLARDNAARIKRMWDEDAGPGLNLKDLQQHLAAAERRYNTAMGVNLPKDAEAIKAEMTQLNKQIKARQDLLASKDLYDPMIKKVQDAANQLVRQMENNRARNEDRLKEALQGLEKARPETEKLPAEQQALAAQLDVSSKALKEAREQYNKTQQEISARSDAMVQGLASQVASQQAKIDDRKKQLAAAAALIPTPEQLAQQAADREHGRQTEYQKKLDGLDKARTAQAEAAEKQDRAVLQFRTVSEQARAADEAADRVRQEAADRQVLLPHERDAEQQVQAVGTRLHNIVEPQKPIESSVTLEGDDPRMIYVLCVTSVGLLLTIILLALLARHPHPVALAYRHADDQQPESGQESFDGAYAQAGEYEDEEDYETADEEYAQPVLTPTNAAAVRGAALVHG
jgi:DNA repair exonuclease SbcCD ATPase subunit